MCFDIIVARHSTVPCLMKDPRFYGVGLDMKRKVLCIFFVIILLCSVYTNLFYIDTIQIKSYKTENDLISYCYLNTIYYNGNSLNLNKILKENKCELKQVFCTYNGQIYFCYTYNEEENLYKSNELFLGSIDCTGNNFVEIIKFNSDCTYETTFGDYYTRMGYFYNGIIVLTDFSNLIEYNIKNNTINNFDYADYPHITIPCTYSVKNNEIVISETNTREIVVDKKLLSTTSKTADKIISLNGNKIWDGTNALEYFFDSVQIVNDEIYLICRVLNFWGSTFALIFKCDLEKQQFYYVASHKTGDVINNFEFYIVPKY